MSIKKDPLDLNFPVAGKTVLVTGAASGIGAAMAVAFNEKGSRVALLDLDEEQARKFADTLHKPFVHKCDVSDETSVNKAVGAVVAEFGTIDILINCAGIVDLAPAEELSLAAWKRTIDINLTGSFLVAQSVGKTMIENGSGKIINIASQAGTVAIPDHVAYCASKFAIIGMTKTMALEWGQHGITVNSISPTVVLTELGKKAWEGPKGDALKKQIPTGRFAEPREIAAAAIFLASDATNMINGADVIIDGGFTIQ